MRKITFAPEAVQDVIAIWEYIAQNNLTAADEIREKIHDDVETLARMPGLGHTRADVKNPA